VYQEKAMRRWRVLIVEDEGIVAMDLENQLVSLGYEVPAIAASGEEAIRRAAELGPDLVLMDIKLRGDMDGLEAAEQIRARADVPVIYLTAFSDWGTLQRAKASAPFAYLLKPIEPTHLRSVVEIALYRDPVEPEPLQPVTVAACLPDEPS
jgi:CheY-like chemotaxis protein